MSVRLKQLAQDGASDTEVLTWNNSSGEWEPAAAGGGGGDNVSVNGTAATDADFDDATPAAPAGGVNVKWQKDTSGPDNISAHLAAGDVVNTVLADMAQATIKGRASGAGTGDPTDLTAAQATAILDAFTSVLKGLVPASGGGTTNFLRADGTWAAPSGGGGASPKAGTVVAASFSGNPDKATVTFATAFADNNYAVSLVCVTTSNKTFAPCIESKSASAFTINLGSNNQTNLTSVTWIATPHSDP